MISRTISYHPSPDTDLVLLHIQTLSLSYTWFPPLLPSKWIQWIDSMNPTHIFSHISCPPEETFTFRTIIERNKWIQTVFMLFCFFSESSLKLPHETQQAPLFVRLQLQGFFWENGNQPPLLVLTNGSVTQFLSLFGGDYVPLIWLIL